MISIQEQDFDQGAEYNCLRANADSDGAIVTFIGLVRDFNQDSSVSSIHIEHYPGMAEKSLMNICLQARKRWQLDQIRVIHRVGLIQSSEQIVFVGISSKHREDAFRACEFIMDFLKTDVPFWKQEGTPSGMKWVDTKKTDEQALTRWSK